MNKISTKDRILDSALTLFAQKGYDGVGVDLIAENAGIKGPSLYKHFKGKEDILDALIDKAEKYYEMNFGSAKHPGKIPSSTQELVKLSLERIQFTLQDPIIKKVRRVLAMEQFRSQRIAELAAKHSMEGIQGMYKKILQGMIDNGVIRKYDSALLSMELVSPISLLIQICDREPQREQEIMELIKAHLNHFVAIYAIK